MPKKKKILIGVGACCFATFIVFMVILLSGQGEMIFPSDVSNVSQTVYTAALSSFKTPPDFEKYAYLDTALYSAGIITPDKNGNIYTDFGGNILNNEAISSADLKNKMFNIKQSGSKQESFYSIQNAIDVNPETGEVFYYDAQFMALNISQDDLTFLNSMNMGAITNKTQLPKWSEIQPLINGYAKIIKF